MRSFFAFVAILLVAVTSFGQIRYRSGIFLHHSTGGCIWGPNGGQVSTSAEIARYNLSSGFSQSESITMAETWWPSGDNEWATWHRIFENRDGANDIRSFFASYPLIMIKSCFPSANMSGQGSGADSLNPTIKSVANYKWHWRSLVSVMKGRPQNFFVIWTNAPQVAGSTTAFEAALSNAFCRWAIDTLALGLDPVIGAFPKNIYVFDFFHLLAGADGMLPLQLASGSSDSHPNAAATTLAAPQLVTQVLDAALAYEVSTQLALPVRLMSFAAVAHGSGVTLNWTTASEVNNYGFFVQTKRAGDEKFSDIPGAFVAGHGTTIAQRNYSYTISEAVDSKTSFRLKQIDLDGAVHFSDPIALGTTDVTQSAPLVFGLDQNYPNPFNPTTTIQFTIGDPQSTILKVYDLLGREVAVLVNGRREVGRYSVEFDASDLAGGMYIYRLQAGAFAATRRLLLLR